MIGPLFRASAAAATLIVMAIASALVLALLARGVWRLTFGRGDEPP